MDGNGHATTMDEGGTCIGDKVQTAESPFLRVLLHLDEQIHHVHEHMHALHRWAGIPVPGEDGDDARERPTTNPMVFVVCGLLVGVAIASLFTAPARR